MQKILEQFEFDRLAIACSGGIDSMCLAFLAAHEAQIVVLIIDHGLRAEAEEEAVKTSEILSSLNIENHIIEIAVTRDGNLQQNARLARYEAMTDWCKANGYDALATGHHAGDNAENFLLRLARGSGVDGLAKMANVIEMNGIKILRPLLNYNKADLQKILEKNDVEWVEDASNATDKYSRNKLRHALEQLEDAELITARINEVSENMARVKSFLQQETDAAEAICVDYAKQQLDFEKYSALHDEIAFRVLMKILARLSPTEKTPRFEKVKNLYSAIHSSEKKTLAGLVFTRKDNKILIELEK